MRTRNMLAKLFYMVTFKMYNLSAVTAFQMEMLSASFSVIYISVKDFFSSARSTQYPAVITKS
jgi:hypothetical protein